MFFNKHVFKGRGVWDKFLFDGDNATCIYPAMRFGKFTKMNFDKAWCADFTLNEAAPGSMVNCKRSSLFTG